MNGQSKAPQTVQKSKAEKSAPSERRKMMRLKLNLPVHISGCDRDHTKWQVITRILDLTQLGACFAIQRQVRKGLILHLSFPMPWRLRQFHHSEPSYKIYGVVRNIATQNDGQYRVGVEFVGEHPPQAYLEKPWLLFNKPEEDGLERRRSERRRTSEIVWVEYYLEPREIVGIEQGCTENVSTTGARICVQSPPLNYDCVKVFALGKGFEAWADVVNQFIGADDITRICVNFRDKQWAAE